MKKKISAVIAAAVLLFTPYAMADSYVNILQCKLKDGKTVEDAHALNSKWLVWARGVAGTDKIMSSFATTVVGESDGYRWVDSYPDLVSWAKVAEADLEEDDPELAAAFEELADCGDSALVNIDPTEAAR